MNDPIPSTFRQHRTLLLVGVGIVLLLVLIVLSLWWLLPRWAPEFVIRYAPMPDLVFRAAIEGDGSTSDASKRLVAMGTRASPAMVAQLHHSDDKARSLALTVLGELRDPQATEAVIAVLTDPRESLQALAIITLEQLGDAQAIPHLLPFLSDKTLSMHAALALQNMPGTAVADALRPLMEQRQDANVLMALYDNQDPRVPAWLDAEMRIEAPVITTHQDEFAWQEKAAYMLGTCSQAGRDLLVKALADTSPAVRKRGAHGLAFGVQQPLSEPERAAVLRLLNDADPSVIEAAVLVYNNHGLEAAVPTLLQLLDSPDPAIRKAATYGFGIRLFDEQATTKLITLTTDPDEQVRVGAVNALGRVVYKPNGRDTRVIPPLIQALADDSPRVREAALYGLNSNHDPQVTARVVDLLDDPDDGVRREAYDQLAGFRRMLTDAQRAKVHAARAKISVTKP